MMRRAARSGFVLPFALVTMVVASIVIVALGGYAAFSSRMVRYHLAQSKCRLLAQSAIEVTKEDIADAFSLHVSKESSKVKVTPIKKDVYGWFDYGGMMEIGSNPVYPIPDPWEFPDGWGGYFTDRNFAVRVWLGERVDGIVKIYARSVGRYAGGPEASVTIEETVVFGGLDQSPVFDNAYFVNNYGWMNGSSIVINGSMRANGNISLSGSTVNGFIYAAANTEVGALGTVSLSSSPQVKNSSGYRTSCGNRGRPDVASQDLQGKTNEEKLKILDRLSDAYFPPETSGVLKKSTETMPIRDLDDPEPDPQKKRVLRKSEPIVNEYADAVPMPFVSDLQDYINYARDEQAKTNSNAQLIAPAYSYTDGIGKARSVVSKTVSAHYDGTGPSGDAAAADKGALVLIGTQANPIKIDGPVVVDSDVIIKGYVKGQGTIYSGRNVHIIGDIIYSDPPKWSHPDSNPGQLSEENATKDMLGLVAKGNIVIGDPTDTEWHESVDNYIKSGTSLSVVKKYACDPSDASIGYPATFQGNYTAVENVDGLTFDKVRTKEQGTGEFVTTREVQYDRWGHMSYKDVTTEKTELIFYTANDRRYYETVCDDSILRTLKDLDARGNSKGIAQIDAILYNNHGIFGTPGRANATFNLNGALVCRDEALIFSGNGIRFNWDYRLGRHSNSKKARRRLGLPQGVSEETCTIGWRELADD